MLKKLQSLKARSKNATKPQKSIPAIHIAFRLWVGDLKVFRTLQFQHGERLFIRGEDGAYSQLTIRSLFEVFEMQHKRGVTYHRSWPEQLKHAAIGGLVGVAITFLLFWAFGVFN